ncbi:hypothetical protein HYFRA_00012878 [Hymenoscyphus fraxineus]|uniref:DUF125-domain-containing protein n=1 Tax=Hymenoscyphus fraxineus TaxID=746836 RepID=A0A9N9PT88_9HELO|nr:hypothetical protein HYFRA_00012878 [Hymenoscyphus fraxineus]
MVSTKSSPDLPESIQLRDRNRREESRLENSNSFQSAAASQATLRRRRQYRTPVGAMSLVAIKNLFYHRKLVPDSQGLPSSITPLLPQEARESDVESQHTAVTENPFNNIRTGLGPVVKDCTIGLADGLTVPFALTAGLSAIGRTDVVIYGGIAEIFAGAISMGLGGWLGTKSEVAEYAAVEKEVTELVHDRAEHIPNTIKDILEEYNFPEELVGTITSNLMSTTATKGEEEKKANLVKFLMGFKYGLSKPDESRALKSAGTIGLSYLIGGGLPLLPYACVAPDQVFKALIISVGIMVLALFAFGYSKTCVFLGWKGGANIKAGCYGGIQMVCLGGLAAAVAMALVKGMNVHSE